MNHVFVHDPKYPDYPPTTPERSEEVGAIRVDHWTWRKKEPLMWFGIPLRKPEDDLLRYQEIIFDTRPEVIFETGGAYGGSALFFRHMQELNGINPCVITASLDWYQTTKPDPNWTQLTGSSTDPDIVRAVHDEVNGRSCLVSLDGDHSCSHVLDEMEAYSDLVQSGHFMVIEDTTVEDVPGHAGVYHGCGPRESIVRWLPENPEFEISRESEPRFLTCNQGGWLRRR